MSFSFHEFKKELMSAITGHALISFDENQIGIFDHIPMNETTPFIVIGDMEVKDWSCQLSEGREIFLNLDLFDTRQSGEVISALSANLEQVIGELSISTYDLVSQVLQSTKSTTRMDGGSFHILQNWRLIIEL